MVALENILSSPWQASMGAYTAPLGDFPGLFLGIFLIAMPTVVVALKTQNVVPPLMVIVFGSFLVAPLAGQFGRYFMLVGGVLFGLLFYMMAKGVRNR